MEDVLYKLIATIEEVAPHVWAIAVRQAYVRGFIALFDVLICAIGLVVAYRAYAWGFNGAKEEDWEGDNPLHIIALILGFIAMLILPFVAWFNAEVAIEYLANPEFAAIEILLKIAGVK